MNITEHKYQLLDFGNQLRLEQWGQYRLIRPDKSAHGAPAKPELWLTADARFVATPQSGHWEQRHQLPEMWTISLDQWQFAVGLSSTKQVGLFPEQLEQWQMIDRLCREYQPTLEMPLRVLNLFAYTGAASIVATVAGGNLTHVDSSHSAIARAKRNQQLNGLSPTSIRWIKEDVQTFVDREIRRGKQYELIIMDPPAYGHGAEGEQFSFQGDSARLLKSIGQLLSPQAIAVIMTTYTAAARPAEVSAQLQRGLPQATITTQPLRLTDSAGRELTTGSWWYAHLD